MGTIYTKIYFNLLNFLFLSIVNKFISRLANYVLHLWTPLKNQCDQRNYFYKGDRPLPRHTTEPGLIHPGPLKEAEISQIFYTDKCFRFIIVRLLLSSVHREGSTGSTARDALLLCAKMSARCPELADFMLSGNTCPVLATGILLFQLMIASPWCPINIYLDDHCFF